MKLSTQVKEARARMINKALRYYDSYMLDMEEGETQRADVTLQKVMCIADDIALMTFEEHCDVVSEIIERYTTNNKY